MFTPDTGQYVRNKKTPGAEQIITFHSYLFPLILSTPYSGKQMKRISPSLLIALVVLLITSTPVFAQSTDHDDVMAAIDTFFEGFAAGDSTMMYSVVDRTSRLVITSNDEDDNPAMRPISMKEFIAIMVRPRDEKIRETYWAPEIRVEQNLAAVWLEYNLWVGDRIDHCGSDHIQLFRSNEGWKIIAIADTQLREGCEAHYK